jgi:hypothetical protein
MGPPIDESILDDYVNGMIKKSSNEKREVYGHVIDFKRLLEDWRSNSLTEKSFVCLDKSFFGEGMNEERKKERDWERGNGREG